MSTKTKETEAASPAIDTLSFRDLLKLSAEETPRPRSLPDGHYIGPILGHEFGRSSKKQTGFVRFELRPEEACNDVDQDQLEGLNLSDKTQRRDFYITPKALHQLSDMLDATLGKQPGRNHDERIPDTTGVRVMFGVKKRLNDNGEDSGFNEVTTIVAVD